jgi:ABC-type multidrug transport system fused ATPase/permease subunit
MNCASEYGQDVLVTVIEMVRSIANRSLIYVINAFCWRRALDIMRCRFEEAQSRWLRGRPNGKAGLLKSMQRMSYGPLQKMDWWSLKLKLWLTTHLLSRFAIASDIVLLIFIIIIIIFIISISLIFIFIFIIIFYAFFPYFPSLSISSGLQRSGFGHQPSDDRFQKSFTRARCHLRFSLHELEVVDERPGAATAPQPQRPHGEGVVLQQNHDQNSR